MKKTFYCLIIASLPAVIIPAASAQTVLLNDNFLVSSNSQNVNQQLASRQTGPLAPSQYVGWSGSYQVGNTNTDVGQPGGATNGNLLLLENSASVYNNLPIGSVATGPLTVQFNMYLQGSNNPSTDTTWGACTLRAAGTTFPVAGTGEFGFLQRANGGLQVFNNGGNIAPSAWDTANFATNSLWTLVFSDTNGTGSAFNGNGSMITFMNGPNLLGTITNVSELSSNGLRLGFADTGNRYVGIGNLSISGTSAGLPPPGQNLSFEYNTTLPGKADLSVPTSWTAFNMASLGDIGSQRGGGTDFTIFDPLAATADGNQFCYINMFNPSVTGGIYQDMGPLQPNTVYTLTVAIGSRNDRINSPGILSLINGVNNTGTVLATGGGLPSTQNTWQDYTATYATGGSVSGDLTIALSVLGNGTSIQADFDNVRLSSVVSSVPVPALLTNTTPTSATVAVGSNVVFTAAYSSSPPVMLQWEKVVNGSPGVTNNINAGVVTVTNNGIISSTLTLNNVQPGDAGSYRLKASNATNLATVVYSQLAPLAVIPLITWYASGAYNYSFSDNSVLALAGSVANEVYGVDFGGSGLQTTANGYTFDDYATSGNMSIAGGGLVNAVGFEGIAFSGDNNFDTVLNYGVQGTSANVGTLKNLTIGQAYTVMVLLDDTRTSGASGPNFTVTDGFSTSPVQRFAFPNGIPALGGYIMGTFIATSTNQPLTVLQNGNAQYIAILLEKGTAPAPSNPPQLLTDIQSIPGTVAAGVPLTFSVEVAGSPALAYQWFNQVGQLSGATNSSYVLRPVAGTDSFHVVITNSFGAVTSSIVAVTSSTNLTLNNFSFESQMLTAGQTIGEAAPVFWTGFNVGGGGSLQNGWDWGISSPNGEFTGPPLAAPADGNNYLWVNRWNGDGTQVAGVYQDVGALLANTTYTLTVAIGQRGDGGPAGAWSPGMISLLNGTNNTGTVLATTNGLPVTANTWQDFTVTYTTGGSVNGDLVIDLSVLDSSHIQADFDNVRLTKATSMVIVAPTLARPTLSSGNLILTGTGGTPNTGYTWLSTTNLSAPINWMTNSTGTLDGSGAFSNSIPIGVSQARFFRLRLP